MADAVHDGIVPCSRRTPPGAGKQRPYIATTAQSSWEQFAKAFGQIIKDGPDWAVAGM